MMFTYTFQRCERREMRLKRQFSWKTSRDIVVFYLVFFLFGEDHQEMSVKFWCFPTPLQLHSSARHNDDAWWDDTLISDVWLNAYFLLLHNKWSRIDIVSDHWYKSFALLNLIQMQRRLNAVKFLSVTIINVEWA